MVNNVFISEINCEDNRYVTWKDLGTILPSPPENWNENKIAFQHIKGSILYALVSTRKVSKRKKNKDKDWYFVINGYIQVSVDDYIESGLQRHIYPMYIGDTDKMVDVTIVPCMSVDNNQDMTLLHNAELCRDKYGYQYLADVKPKINIVRYDENMEMIGTDIIRSLYDFSRKNEYMQLVHRTYDIFINYIGNVTF